NATITVVRGGGSSGSVTVNYATSDRTAHAGIDYTAVSGTPTFAHGVTSQPFHVPINDDPIVSGSRTINPPPSNPSGIQLCSPSTAMLTSLDDESFAPTSTQPFNNQVQLGNISITSSSIASDGNTPPVPIDPISTGPGPNGYTITGPAYDISTTATFDP